MDLTNDFYYKNKFTVTSLAREFYMMRLDEKLPTITGLMEKFGVSRGTIQLAMKFLNDQGCIESRFRGKLGSYLVEKDDDKLWDYTGYGVLTGAMYLPLNDMSAGLATGICECMTQKKIPFNCAFIQGSKTRINALLCKKNDFVVASRLTANLVVEQHDQLEWAMDLPETMYAGTYVLLFNQPDVLEVCDGMTVAVDSSSMDQDHLTSLLCRGKQVERLEISYTNTPKAVEKGLADVTVARMDVVEKKYSGLYIQKILVDGYTPNEIESFSESVIIINRDNYGIAELLKKAINPALVSVTQKQVMEHKRFSNYY